MAKRPIFVPIQNDITYIDEVILEFEWFPGHARSQVRKSINSLHSAAGKKGISPVLEISSKSTEPLGISLSAFNLTITVNTGQQISVECAFQGSKVFENGGPFTDLYAAGSRKAKTDQRIKNSGKLIEFKFYGEGFPTDPITAFYDWLYIKALYGNQDIAKELLNYKGFTDIAFNPKKSRNCQARSAALYVALSRKEIIERAVKDKEYFIKEMKKIDSPLFSDPSED